MLSILGISFCTFFFSLIVFVYFLHEHRNSSNASFGPKSYPVLGCLISFYKNKHRILDWYTGLLKQSPHQTIVIQRLGATRTVVTANPKNIEYILKTNFNNYPKGKPFTDLLGDLLGQGIFNVDGDHWRLQRKFASHEFSTKSLREFTMNALDEEIHIRLIPLLDSFISSNSIIDFQDILRRFAFDTICKVTLGTNPGCLDPSLPDSILAKEFDTASEICVRRGTAPISLFWKIKRALCIGSERKLRESVRAFHSSVMVMIHNRIQDIDRNGENQGRDLLSKLILAGFEKEMIRDMIISFIMAGRETTSSALTWFFWLISCHPHIEEELLEELTKYDSISFETLKKMNMVKACLCESMRLYPPVAWDSKYAVQKDHLPDGTRVEKGDRITYFPYGMGRMESVWGKDCMEFRPDRWLITENNISSYKFPVFQAGPRICLGKEMAFLQMTYIAAVILKKYQLKLVRRDQPVFVPLLTAYMAGGLKVQLQQREMKISAII